MSENIDVTGNPSDAESSDTMQAIQDMIGDLLKNAVDKLHKKDIDEQLGGSPSEGSGIEETTAQMDIKEVRQFIGFMQKFIDNVTIMVDHLEYGTSKPGMAEENFIEGYMATADTILEIAAFSTKDPLTGFSNRYGFDNRLILEWNRAARDKTNLGVVLFCIDDFAGNEEKEQHESMLIKVANALKLSTKRSTDFIARWSENEFAILLPITDENGTSIVAERILSEFLEMDIPGWSVNNDKANVSIGVYVHMPEPGERVSEFMDTVYSAYSKAKEDGGNSIVYA
jgi:diguanylate cyclase (GGDEF)-like protein